MNILWYIIKNLSDEEVRQYRMYARRFNRTGNRKDFKLLELYRIPGEPDDEKIRLRLYGNTLDTNTYARLKNRLASDVNKAMVLSMLDEKAMEPWYLYLTFKYHDTHNRHEAAAYYLKKALKKAEETGQFDLAVMVCHSFLRSARYRQLEKEESILEKRDLMEKFSALMRRMEVQSAVLEEELRRSQSLYKVKDSLINSARAAEKAAEKEQPLPRPLLLQWLKLKAQIWILQHHYDAIVNLLTPYKLYLLGETAPSPEQAELQATLLIYLMNAHTMLGDYGKVTQVAPLLDKLLKQSPELSARYGFFYYQSTVAALCRTERYSEALSVIRHMEEENETRVNPRYLVFASINKALCLYETGHWQEALKTLARLKTWEAFEQTDSRIQKEAEIFEILLRILLGDLDYAFQRAKHLLTEGALPDEADTIILKHLNTLSRKPLSQFRSYILKNMLTDDFLRTNEERQVIRYDKWALLWAETLHKAKA